MQKEVEGYTTYSRKTFPIYVSLLKFCIGVSVIPTNYVRINTLATKLNNPKLIYNNISCVSIKTFTSCKYVLIIFIYSWSSEYSICFDEILIVILSTSFVTIFVCMHSIYTYSYVSLSPFLTRFLYFKLIKNCLNSSIMINRENRYEPNYRNISFFMISSVKVKWYPLSFFFFGKYESVKTDCSCNTLHQNVLSCINKNQDDKTGPAI